MVDIVMLWSVSMSPIDIVKVQHTWHPIVHGPSVGRADVDGDKDDNMALHVSTGTKLTQFGKLEDENDYFCSLGTKLSFADS
jgi:hypothetical protein